MRKRAMTLVELMVVMGLFSLMAGLTVINMRRSPASASSKSVAQIVAAELRQARAEALRQHAPVAICFPSDNGVRPASPGFYWLVGDDKARVQRSVDLSKQYPNACVFWGFWNLDTSQMSNPTALNSNAPPRMANREDGFDPSLWVMPNTKDGAVIFTPSGGVTSNGLVHFDGAYHLVVAGGVAATAGAVPGGVASPLTYYTPSSLGDPYTISLSLQGDVQIVKGLPCSDGSVALDGTGLTTRSTLPAVSSGANSNPQVNPSECSILPAVDPSLLPSGVGALVPVDRFLTLKIQATDPDGDPLRIRWTTTGGAYFSDSGEFRPMEWNQSEQRWEYTVEWRPPSTALPGDPFQLSCEIQDGRGGSATVDSSALAALSVRSSQRGKLVTTYRYGSVVTICNPDGSGLREINMPDTICSISATPDGERLVFSYWGGGPYYGSIAAINLDGTNHRILNGLGDLCEPDVAPSGRVVTMQANGLRLMNGDGSNFTNLTNSLYDEYPRWSPDESKIAFARLATGKVMTINPDGSGPTVLADGEGPQWSPDGSKILYKQSDGVHCMNADGTNPTLAVSCSSSCLSNSCCWSPDGSQIAYLDGNDVWIADADGSNGKKIITLPQVDTLLWTR